MTKEIDAAIEALEQVDALINHQYTGTSAGMTDLQYAFDACDAALAGLRSLKEQEPVGSTKMLHEMITMVNETDSARWEIGFRNIVAILYGPRHSFEIADVVERVRELAHPAPEAKQEQNKCAQCNKEYRKGSGVGCPKCAKGVDIAEVEFRKPLPAPEATVNAHLQDRIAELEAEYNDLIYSAGKKYPGESRHDTELQKLRRYLIDREKFEVGDAAIKAAEGTK